MRSNNLLNNKKSTIIFVCLFTLLILLNKKNIKKNLNKEEKTEMQTKNLKSLLIISIFQINLNQLKQIILQTLFRIIS
jgi:hypothetical protein